jgi:hypothetical protein
MPNTNRFSYKGYSITTRWIELGPLANRKGKRFNASFTVDPPALTELSWQEFPKAVFETQGGAADNALMVAKKAIDLNLKIADASHPPGVLSTIP